MRKVKTIKRALIGLGAAGIIAVVAAVSVTAPEPVPVEEITVAEVQNCSEIELAFGETKICVTKEDYKTIKKNLHKEYKNKSKDYDFNINNRDIFYAILDKEIKEKGIPFSKLKDKDYIMEEFFNK